MRVTAIKTRFVCGGRRFSWPFHSRPVVFVFVIRFKRRENDGFTGFSTEFFHGPKVVFTRTEPFVFSFGRRDGARLQAGREFYRVFTEFFITQLKNRSRWNEFLPLSRSVFLNFRRISWKWNAAYWVFVLDNLFPSDWIVTHLISLIASVAWCCFSILFDSFVSFWMQPANFFGRSHQCAHHVRWRYCDAMTHRIPATSAEVAALAPLQADGAVVVLAFERKKRNALEDAGGGRGGGNALRRSFPKDRPMRRPPNQIYWVFLFLKGLFSIWRVDPFFVPSRIPKLRRDWCYWMHCILIVHVIWFRFPLLPLSPLMKFGHKLN